MSNFLYTPEREKTAASGYLRDLRQRGTRSHTHTLVHTHTREHALLHSHTVLTVGQRARAWVTASWSEYACGRVCQILSSGFKIKPHTLKHTHTHSHSQTNQRSHTLNPQNSCDKNYGLESHTDGQTHTDERFQRKLTHSQVTKY